MCSRTSGRIGSQLGGGHLEDQLVVHLQQHPARESALPDRAMDPDHGELDQVGRGALERRVLRVPLAVGPHVEVPVLDLGDVAPPLEERLDVALFPGQLDLPVEKGTDPGEPLEVAGDEPFASSCEMPSFRLRAKGPWP